MMKLLQFVLNRNDKKLFFIVYNLLFLFTISASYAQSIVSKSPANANGDTELTITYDATQGTAGLVGADKVYIHSGVITVPGGTEWEENSAKIIGNWGEDDGVGEMTKVEGENNKWEITLTPRDYYQVSDGTSIYRIAMVFRNADGSKEGKATGAQDIYLDLDAGKYIIVSAPVAPFVFVNAGSNDELLVKGSVSEQAQRISIQVDRDDDGTTGFLDVGTSIANEDDFEIKYSLTDVSNTSENDKEVKLIFKVTAEFSSGDPIEKTQEITVHVFDPNKTSSDNTDDWDLGFVLDSEGDGGRFAIQAPQYTAAYIVGSFNDWKPEPAYQLTKSTHRKQGAQYDDDIFYIDIETFPGLTANAVNNIQYQYILIGNPNIGTKYVQVADPYSTLVVDPYQDEHIDDKTFPDRPAPENPSSGICSLLQLGIPTYQWSENEAKWKDNRPHRSDLTIYELLIRDFHEDHSYQSLIDHFDYFKDLNINTIELLPVQEFEGNLSWGYNPSFHMALDKYYGPPASFKAFVDKCHQNGIAVVIDAVYNHVFSQSPLFQMYKDPQDNTKTTTTSPYTNPIAKHPYNVGTDVNHDSRYTQRWVEQTLEYWVDEYHVDGFRFDLTKGFTQKDTGSDVGAWSAYDQDRIDNILRYTDKLQTKDPKLYLIIEHLGVNSEEVKYTEKGVMPWRIMHSSYKEIAIGYPQNTQKSNISGSKTENWVSYMESHDEERLMYEVKNVGRTAPINLRANEKLRFERMQTIVPFFLLVPGPKMMWQFQELGYDISIEINGRTGNKPYALEGFGEGTLALDTKKNNLALQNVFKGLLSLRKKYPDALRSGDFSWNQDNGFQSVAWLTLDHKDLKIAAVSNMDIETKNITFDFPTTGTWYDLFKPGDEGITITKKSKTMELKRHEFHVFINKKEDQYTALTDVLSIEHKTPFESKIQFFPNPNKGVLSIKLPDNMNFNSNQQALLTIKNLNAKLLKSVPISKTLYDGQFLNLDLRSFGFNHAGPAIITLTIGKEQFRALIIFE